MSPEDRRRGPYRKGLEQRQRILEQATLTFARSGFAAATLRSIASAIGVSHASIIQLFGTKQALLLAVLQRWDEQLGDRLAGRRGIDFLRSIDELMDAHQEQREILGLFLVLAAEASDPDHPAHDFMLERSERVRRMIETHIRLAVQAGQLRALTSTEISDAVRELTSMMNGMELQWMLRPASPLRAPFARFAERWLSDLT